MTKPAIPEWEGAWIGTNTGKVITLEREPLSEMITIEDIANALSNIARFNGHTKQWYSVAEHCIHVAELVPNKYKLQALLHDATEAYIGDVTTPLKRVLGEAYKSIERRLAGAIGEKFGVDLINLHESVTYADRMMVVTERDALQAVVNDWGPAYETVNRYPNFTRHYASSIAARDAYLTAFKRYTSKQF